MQILRTSIYYKFQGRKEIVTFESTWKENISIFWSFFIEQLLPETQIRVPIVLPSEFSQLSWMY
jgi:hypothetical protein